MSIASIFLYLKSVLGACNGDNANTKVKKVHIIIDFWFEQIGINTKAKRWASRFFEEGKVDPPLSILVLKRNKKQFFLRGVEG